MLGATGSDRPEPNKAIAVGDRVPDFTLTDQTGRAVRLSQFRGAPVAVTFAYTRCPVATACPMTMAKFSKMNAAIAGKDVGRLLVVTVDPENDTPAVLADFATRIGADDARWKFLTGDPRARRAGGRDLRRSLLPGARPDRALAGGRGRRPGGQARHRSTTDREWEPERYSRICRKRGRDETHAGSRQPRLRSDREARRGALCDRAEKEEHPSKLFKEYCAKCHGEDGKADTSAGKNLKARNFTDAEWQTGETDAELIESVTEGKDDMPPFGKKLTKEQIESLVKNDVRGFATK